ncbi:MAG: T9SS type A sorting domain-containing protein [Sporocytophaga sp.]|uniref:T9SS type A sorting domain-containing protein n=1 Tax=Sporocytophaga sp. TaxID=2231183 RepID=UPI001B03A850|nr:T9SS type A sorting domain-containing protein [Sporocytophaga sp.]MBO9701938.1 T9SS type A sorting domain-containing protein [Sporocytophaga sp.]
MKTFYITLILFSIMFQPTQAQWVQMGNRLNDSEVTDNGCQGQTLSISSDGKTLAVGAPGDSTIGAARVYSLSNNQWIQMGGKLIGSGSVGYPHQGNVMLSSDGKTLAVGGIVDNDGVGAVWVYKLFEGKWVQMGNKLVGSGMNGRAFFGCAISLSSDGKTLAIGGTQDDNASGAVWIYSLAGEDWVQMGNKLVASGATGRTEFGSFVSLSADGKTLAISGPFDNDGIGAVWMYNLSDQGWIPMGDKLVGSGHLGKSLQGCVSLSADGKKLAVGGMWDNANAGATWVFTLSDNGWVQTGNKLVGTGAIGQSAQGASVYLSGDGNTLAIGGPADNGIGATWVFALSENNWVQVGEKLIASGIINTLGQKFGSYVTLDSLGRTLAVGMPSCIEGGTFIFTNTGVLTNFTDKKNELNKSMVYPNPFNQALNIDIPQKTTYIIYDLNGTPVETGTSSSSNIGVQQASGIYYLKVNNQFFKIVKISN